MTTQEQQQPMTIQKYLEARRESLAQMVPKHLTVDRLLKVALNAISKSEKLKLCTMASVLQCVVTCAELGLEPGGALGEAYLVPFKTWNREKKQETYTCTLIIGYRGYVTLMRRSSQLSTIKAVIVRERDKFRYVDGIETILEHEPCLDGDPGRKVRCVYCVIKLADGGVQVDVMEKYEVDLIRSRSRSADDGPWVTDYNEMAKKTVVRRASKLAPMSPELARALEAEDEYVDGEVVRRDASALSLVGGEKVQAPAAPVAQLQAPRPEPIPSNDGLEEKLKESVEVATSTGSAPRATPPQAISFEESILAAIESATKPADLNQIAARIGKVTDPEVKGVCTAAYSAKAKALRGGAR